MQEYTVKIDDNGDKFWYQNGKRHRLDGPAIEYSDGYKFWYINGKDYTKDAYDAEIKRLSAPKIKEMTVAEIEAALGYSVKVVKG